MGSHWSSWRTGTSAGTGKAKHPKGRALIGAAQEKHGKDSPEAQAAIDESNRIAAVVTAGAAAIARMDRDSDALTEKIAQAKRNLEVVETVQKNNADSRKQANRGMHRPPDYTDPADDAEIARDQQAVDDAKAALAALEGESE